MYLFLTALVVGNPALAFDPTIPPPKPPIIIVPGGCGTRPPPCLGLQDADGEILPPDWLVMQRVALDGELNFFRVELYLFSGDIDVELAGSWLSERNYSAAESDRHVSVYYVPAAGADILVKNLERAPADFELVISGEAKSGI